MSVNVPTGKTTRNQNANTSAQQSQPQQQQDDEVRGLSNMRNRFRGAAERGLTGEVVRQYEAAFKKAAADMQRVRILPFDRTTHNTAVSAILICRSFTLESGSELVVVSTQLLEASNQRITARTIQTGTQSIEIPSTPGDTFNNNTTPKVEAFVRSHYPNADVRLAAASTIIKEIPPTDEAHIQRAFAYALEACVGTADIMNNFQLREIFSVKEFTESDRVLVRIESNVQGVEMAGVPVRSDLALQITGTTGNGSDVFNRNEIPILTVDTYLELAYKGPTTAVIGAPPASTAIYQPIINIPMISSELEIETLELRILGMAMATLVASNETWITPLVPRLNRSTGHLRDIGALAYEMTSLVNGQAGVKIDTRSNAFDDTVFRDIMSRAVRPELFFKYHVHEASEMSWLDSVFLFAAQGDQTATEAIIAACNRLTCNHFAAQWTNVHGDGRVAYNDNVRIPVGFFVDGTTNTRRSLNEITYLELLTQKGLTDLQYVQTVDNFMNNKDNNSIDARFRMHLDMLTNVLEGNFELKGSAYPITLSNDWLGAVVAGLVAAGFNAQPTNVANCLASTERRGFDAGQTRAYSQNQSAGLFRQNNPRGTGPVLANNLRFGGRR